jgi:hypothetical protein
MNRRLSCGALLRLACSGQEDSGRKRVVRSLSAPAAEHIRLTRPEQAADHTYRYHLTLTKGFLDRHSGPVPVDLKSRFLSGRPHPRPAKPRPVPTLSAISAISPGVKTEKRRDTHRSCGFRFRCTPRRLAYSLPAGRGPAFCAPSQCSTILPLAIRKASKLL